jgi:CRP/FNR family transcriptional regulator, anaerobic regulatory protein
MTRQAAVLAVDRRSTSSAPVKPMAPVATVARIGPQSDIAMAGGRLYARKWVRRAQALYHAGGWHDCLFGIRSGTFKSTMALEDGREQVVGFHMAGDFLGMDGIDGECHASDAIALEDSEVYIMPLARLEDPGVRRQVYKAMCRELVRDRSTMLLLGTMRSSERVAAFLLELSQRLFAHGFSSREFYLRMTRRDIGSYLGLSLETVSRLLSRFQQDRLIRVNGKHIHIRDAEALRALLGEPGDQRC